MPPSTLYMWIKDFLREYSITGATMNTINTPMLGDISLPVLIYIIAAVITAGILVIRKKFSKTWVIKPLIISFIVAGFLFILRMDYNWFDILKKDINAFSGKNVEERIALLEINDFYGFIKSVKDAIPEGGKARYFPQLTYDYYSLNDYYSLKGRYYLLPVKSSVSGEFIWVYQNSRAYFEPSNGTLTVGSSVISPVKLIASYGEDGYLFRETKER